MAKRLCSKSTLFGTLTEWYGRKPFSARRRGLFFSLAMALAGVSSRGSVAKTAQNGGEPEKRLTPCYFHLFSCYCSCQIFMKELRSMTRPGLQGEAGAVAP